MKIGLLGFGAINQKVYQYFSKINTNIRFKKINGQIENPAQYNQIKKNIARLNSNLKNIK